MSKDNKSKREGMRGREAGNGISRRRLMHNASALGLSSIMLGGMYDAIGVVPASAANFDPKKYAGTKISLLMVGGEGDDKAVADLAPQLKAETGIELEVQAPALGAADREDFSNRQIRPLTLRVDQLSRLPDHSTGRRWRLHQLNSYIENAERDARRTGTSRTSSRRPSTTSVSMT